MTLITTEMRTPRQMGGPSVPQPQTKSAHREIPSQMFPAANHIATRAPTSRGRLQRRNVSARVQIQGEGRVKWMCLAEPTAMVSDKSCGTQMGVVGCSIHFGMEVLASAIPAAMPLDKARAALSLAIVEIKNFTANAQSASTTGRQVH